MQQYKFEEWCLLGCYAVKTSNLTVQVCSRVVRNVLMTNLVKRQTPWLLVRMRTMRPPLVCLILVPTFADSGVSRGQRGGTPTVVNLRFLDRSRYFSFKSFLIYAHEAEWTLSRPTATHKIW
jgi:hypothetical protein